MYSHNWPRTEPVELRQINRDGVAQFSDEERERHAVDIARGRWQWWVDVTVSVDPDHRRTVHHAGVTVHWTDRDAVVSAEN